MELYNKVYTIRKNIFEGIASLFKFRHFRIYALMLFLLNIFTWLSAYSIFIKSNNELIFLHSNVDFGVDLIGEAKNIFIIPILGLTIFLFNLIVSSSIIKVKDSKFLSHLLLGSAIMAHLFLLVSLASIYLINYR